MRSLAPMTRPPFALLLLFRGKSGGGGSERQPGRSHRFQETPAIEIFVFRGHLNSFRLRTPAGTHHGDRNSPEYVLYYDTGRDVYFHADFKSARSTSIRDAGPAPVENSSPAVRTAVDEAGHSYKAALGEDFHGGSVHQDTSSTGPLTAGSGASVRTGKPG